MVLEGLQQLQQYQENWINYRSTCERLRAERFLFLSRAGPYAGVAGPEGLLAVRVEGLVSQENSAWVALPRGRGSPAGERGMSSETTAGTSSAGAEALHQLPA